MENMFLGFHSWASVGSYLYVHSRPSPTVQVARMNVHIRTIPSLQRGFRVLIYQRRGLALVICKDLAAMTYSHPLVHLPLVHFQSLFPQKGLAFPSSARRRGASSQFSLEDPHHPKCHTGMKIILIGFGGVGCFWSRQTESNLICMLIRVEK